MNVCECLLKHQDKEKVALKYGDKSISFKNLYRDAQRVAKTVSEVEDSVIGVVMKNSIDYVVLYFAILFAGKIVHVLNEKEIEASYQDIGVKTYIVDKEIFEKYNRETISAEITIFSSDDILERREEEKKVLMENNKDALLLCTSGTSGKKKYVLLSHENLMTNVYDAYEMFLPHPDENELILLPLSSAFSNTMQLLSALYVGRTSVLYQGKIVMEKIFEIIEKEKITYSAMVPSLVRLFAEHYDPKKHNLSSFRKIGLGGETIDERELESICNKLKGVYVLQGYGMTEASPTITAQCYGDEKKKPGSVGKPFRHVKLRIVDENGKEQPPNQPGELMVKGESIIDHYYQEQSILKEGWFCTGDLGYIDEQGYLYLTGRKKNLIISAGKNISPEEIENVLLMHAGVMQAYVYGENNSIVGERVVALVVAGENVKNSVLMEHCKAFLADYKIPKKIIRVDKIEVNSLGKTYRNQKTQTIGG